jgi:hypothetical protein
MDLFDKPETLRVELPKLVRGYAIDALEDKPEEQVNRADVELWIQKAQAAEYKRFDSPGLGDDVRVSSADMVGSGLIVDECPVHIELYPADRADPDRARAGADPTPAVPDSRPAAAPVVPDPPSGRRGIVAIATSEMLLAELGKAVEVLRPVFATRPLRLSRSGLLIRMTEGEHDRLDGSNPILSHAEEAALVRRVVQRTPEAELRMVFTGCGLADNWFSHWHEAARTTVISARDWNLVSQFPLAAAAARAIVRDSLRVICPSCPPESLMHEQTRGCPFDFCGRKTDVNRAFETGRLCPACQRQLASAGVDVDLFNRALHATRLLAGRPTPTGPIGRVLGAVRGLTRGDSASGQS